MGVHPEAFKAALAALPSGVTVITSIGSDGLPVGATVSAFMSLSLEPPLVLLSLKAASRTALAIKSSGAFTAHIVGDEHRNIAVDFSVPGADRFVGLNHRPGASGAPVIEAFNVRLECVLYSDYPVGDHIIVIGLVQAAESQAEKASAPVAWYKQRFHRIFEMHG